MSACDFHTHHRSGLRPELISAPHKAGEGLFSLEIHPWQLPERFILPETYALQKSLLQFNALGEVGLDRLHGPDLEVQMQYLKSFLTLARECRKPVIFHVVRAWPELFSIISEFPGLRWAVHGFRHSPELLDELWKRGATVSFHRSLIHNPALLAELKAPQGKFGFESDDLPDCPLEDIAAEAMDKSGNPDLLNLSTAAFMEFVNDAG